MGIGISIYCVSGKVTELKKISKICLSSLRNSVTIAYSTLLAPVLIVLSIDQALVIKCHFLRLIYKITQGLSRE